MQPKQIKFKTIDLALLWVTQYRYILQQELRYKLLEGKLNNDKEFNYNLWEEKYQKSQLPQKGAHFQYQNIRTGQHPEKQG